MRFVLLSLLFAGLVLSGCCTTCPYADYYNVFLDYPHRTEREMPKMSKVSEVPIVD